MYPFNEPAEELCQFEDIGDWAFDVDQVAVVLILAGQEDQ